MSSGPCVLVAAFSARALCEAARLSGFTPLATDLFGDADTLAAAHAFEPAPGSLENGFDAGGLVEALVRLERAAPSPPLGLVYGAGFEAGDAALLARLERRGRIIGNPSALVARSKNPFTLQRALREAGVPHPETVASAVAARGRWLAKTAGGAGGGHVRRADPAIRRCGTYYQREIEGRAVSALFIAGAEGIEIVGFSVQWTAPAPDAPFRYGGAAQPVDIAPEVEAAMALSVERAARALGLAGLNSADFILEGREHWLIEINPRPGATLDIFDAPAARLFGRHVAAFVGGSAERDIKEPWSVERDIKEACSAERGIVEMRSAERGIVEMRSAERGIRKQPDAAAAGVIYAPRDATARRPETGWPGWLKDRPRCGAKLLANQPACTVLARGNSLGEAMALFASRAEIAKTLIET